jgi:hypothetical protein
MSDKVNDLLGDFNVTLEFSVKELNTLLNVLAQSPFIQVVNFINEIQTQAGPQVEQARKSLEAVEKANES